MAVHRETLRIEGDTRSAEEALESLDRGHKRNEETLGSMARQGLMAYQHIRSAVQDVIGVAQIFTDEIERNVSSLHNLERTARSLMAMKSAITPEEQQKQQRRIQGLMFEFGVRDSARITALLTEVESQFAQRPEAVEPTVRYALQAQLGAGAPPTPIAQAIAKTAGAYPERGADIQALGDLLFRAYQQAPIGAYGEFAGAIPEVVTSGAAAGVPLEDVLTAHILMTRGAPSADVAATRVRAGLDALLGKTAEARRFMAEQGLVGLPLRERLARVGQLVAGKTPEERAVILEPYLPDVRGRRGVEVAIAGLGDWDAIQRGLAGGGVTMADLAEAARRLGSFAEDQTAAGILALENIRGEGDQVAGLNSLKDLYRARGVQATPAGWLATFGALRTWFIRQAGLEGAEAVRGPITEAGVRAETAALEARQLGEAGAFINKGTIINYGVKNPADTLRMYRQRPAARIKG